MVTLEYGVESRADERTSRRCDPAQSMRIFVCTGESLVRLEHDAGAWRAETVLDGGGVQCVAVDGARILAGTRGRGAFVSDDTGDSWEPVELPEADVFSVAIGPADGALYAGTEPSRLFVVRAGRWEELEALQDIPSRERWSFPPRPWTHHVRWIAPDPHRADRLLVGIELGGVMYSRRRRRDVLRPPARARSSTRTASPGTRAPTAAPTRPRATAPRGAATAAARSQAADAGRDLGYCWALAVDPADPERWYVSAATGPCAAHSRRAGAWPALPLGRRLAGARRCPATSMPYALATADGELVAGMADGRLLRSADSGESWTELGVRVDSIVALAT